MMKLKKDSSSNQSKEEEKENEWNITGPRHGSFHTPMVKNGNKNRRESSAWAAYNKLEERRKESESDDWSDLRKQSMDYGNLVAFDEIVYDEHDEPKANGEKCYPMFMGGTKLPKGHTQSSMQPVSCSSLRCFNCDKKVHRFLNGKWNPSVDYLFVRNHNTNLPELQKGVEFEKGSSAYACQCKFVTVYVSADPNRAEEMKWMCGGH
jgi:hypothetical protein